VAASPCRGLTRSIRTASASKGIMIMFDVAYILLGAVFLGACVLYVYACDRL
jgi:hypothetical protein